MTDSWPLYEKIAAAAAAAKPATPADQAVPSVWRRATVEETNPIRIRLDGDTAALPLTPTNLAGNLTPGRRVWVQRHGRRAVIHGAVSLATDWVDCTIHAGFAARDPQYHPQVRRDTDGMVHFRGHFSNTGLSGTDVAQIMTIPPGFVPEMEVRFLAWQTNRTYILGGWISIGSGLVNLQMPDGPPSTHFSLIMQPWQAAL